MQTKSSKGTQRKEGWRYCQREERKLKSATDVMKNFMCNCERTC